MSSDRYSDPLPLDPQPPLQHPLPDTETLRSNLHRLDLVAQSLKVEKATLENKLKIVKEKIVANDSEIRSTMDSLGKQLFQEQRSERQPDFCRSVIEDDNFIEGMYFKMQMTPQLNQAIHNIINDHATNADNNMMAMNILLELTGDTFKFAHDVAARVSEFSHQRNAGPANFNPSTPLPHPIRTRTPLVDPALLGPDSASTIAGPSTALVPAARDPSILLSSLEFAGRDPSIISLNSVSIKSDPDTTHNSFGMANNLSALGAAALQTMPGGVAASVESESPTQTTSQANTIAHGMTSLQKQYPGLLESLNTTPRTRAANANIQGKRGREGEQEPSVSPPNRAVKKVKMDKDPGKRPSRQSLVDSYSPTPTAISHTFIMFMKQLEQMHRSSQSIASTIKCCRCQQIKRDVRVLNCLHMYCHRCVLQLRGEAQHGNAVTGFQSTCVKAGCKQIVSGKTTVIDSEIMDFLQWYDQQAPALASIPAQLHLLNTAVTRYPDDDAIKAKLQHVQSQFAAMQATGRADHQLADLMQIAKLCRKPYLNGRD